MDAVIILLVAGIIFMLRFLYGCRRAMAEPASVLMLEKIAVISADDIDDAVANRNFVHPTFAAYHFALSSGRPKTPAVPQLPLGQRSSR